MKTKPLFSNPLKKQEGFTLLEMLVALVIIGLLAGLVGPRLYMQADIGKQKTAGVQVKMLKGVLDTMRLDIGRFPTTEEGLNLLRAAPVDETIKPFWKGPYLDEAVPLDPWNRPYQYANSPSADGQPFTLYSFGADGKLGGEDFNNDIGYTPTQ